MNTGIGDAMNLAWKLAAVLKGTPPIIGGKQTNGADRLCARLVATTDRLFTLVTKQGRSPGGAHRLVPPVSPLLFRPSPIRRFLFRTVSQTGISYRHSPLSMGMAGTVQGGHRLPWVETEPKKTISSRSLRSPGRSMCTENRDAAWPKRAQSYSFPSHVFAWQPEMRCAPASGRGQIPVVRPDGYIALADPNGDPGRLGRYFMSRGLPVALRRDEATRFEPAPVRPGSPGVSPWGVGR